MENIGTLAIKVREIRERLGLTQVALAKKLGINAQTIRDYEAGRRSPPVKNLKALAEALGVSASDLVSSEESAPLVIPVSETLKKLLSIPDSVYEMAQYFDSSDEAWKTVMVVLEDAKKDKEKKLSKQKKA